MIASIPAIDLFEQQHTVPIIKCDYAIVHWFNAIDDLSAGFVCGFNSLEEAEKHAYYLASEDLKDLTSDKSVCSCCGSTSAEIITENEITCGESSGNPYDEHAIISYGASQKGDGYCTTFYSVVKWFDGVQNYWDETNDYTEEDVKNIYNGEWYPIYGDNSYDEF